ncbi:MAG: class I SAM-dependent methyltransferase [Candidatus Rifleibacteriota bacterium]
MSSDWKKFFDQIAPEYDSEVFTRDTVAEVDFLIEELRLKPGATILDIGCGTGRHSVELAKRGFSVTGVDISSGMLAQAKFKAEKAGVNIEFIESPAQDFKPARKFDAVVSLCEGALCLFSESDDFWAKDMAIFANIAEALEPGSPFLVTVLSAFRMIREYTDKDVESGAVDLFHLTTTTSYEVDRNGVKASINAIERYYTPPELVRMVNRVGLKIDNFYGGTAGCWARRPIRLDEYEIMAVGHRKDHKGRSFLSAGC